MSDLERSTPHGELVARLQNAYTGSDGVLCGALRMTLREAAEALHTLSETKERTQTEIGREIAEKLRAEQQEPTEDMRRAAATVAKQTGDPIRSDKERSTLHQFDRLAARILQGDGLSATDRATIAATLTAAARHSESFGDVGSESCYLDAKPPYTIEVVRAAYQSGFATAHRIYSAPSASRDSIIEEAAEVCEQLMPRSAASHLQLQRETLENAAMLIRALKGKTPPPEAEERKWRRCSARECQMNCKCGWPGDCLLTGGKR